MLGRDAVSSRVWCNIILAASCWAGGLQSRMHMHMHLLHICEKEGVREMLMAHGPRDNNI